MSPPAKDESYSEPHTALASLPNILGDYARSREKGQISKAIGGVESGWQEVHGHLLAPGGETSCSTDHNGMSGTCRVEGAAAAPHQAKRQESQSREHSAMRRRRKSAVVSTKRRMKKGGREGSDPSHQQLTSHRNAECPHIIAQRTPAPPVAKETLHAARPCGTTRKPADTGAKPRRPCATEDARPETRQVMV